MQTRGAPAGGRPPAVRPRRNRWDPRYGLSRPTVRRAVQELVDKGLLVRKRGVGTQVIQPHVRRSVELTSLYDDMIRAGEAPTTEVLSLDRVPASAEIAQELDVHEGDDVVVLRRLRRSHGEPLALMTNHRPGRRERRRRGCSRSHPARPCSPCSGRPSTTTAARWSSAATSTGPRATTS